MVQRDNMWRHTSKCLLTIGLCVIAAIARPRPAPAAPVEMAKHVTEALDRVRANLAAISAQGYSSTATSEADITANDRPAKELYEIKISRGPGGAELRFDVQHALHYLDTNETVRLADETVVSTKDRYIEDAKGIRRIMQRDEYGAQIHEKFYSQIADYHGSLTRVFEKAGSDQFPLERVEDVEGKLHLTFAREHGKMRQYMRIEFGGAQQGNMPTRIVSGGRDSEKEVPESATAVSWVQSGNVWVPSAVERPAGRSNQVLKFVGFEASPNNPPGFFAPPLETDADVYDSSVGIQVSTRAPTLVEDLKVDEVAAQTDLAGAGKSQGGSSPGALATAEASSLRASRATSRGWVVWAGIGVSACVLALVVWSLVRSGRAQPSR